MAGPISKLLDFLGRPVDQKKLAEMEAEPSLQGVRQVISDHAAEGLTPAKLASLHKAAAQGDPFDYLALAEDIEERDPQYLTVLATRKRSVSQLPIRIEAVSDDAKHIEQADFIRQWLQGGTLANALFDMLDGIGKGYSVMETDWRTDPATGFLPRRLVYRPQRWFEFDKADGEALLLRTDGDPAPMSPYKFVIHKHPSKSGLTIRSGLARAASWAWMYKAFTSKDWAIFVQNYGQPIRIGKYGRNATKDERDILRKAVANIAGDCAAVLPKEMTLEFIEVKSASDSADVYQKRMEYYDQVISKLVLGQTTTTDAIVGGHAVSREHRLVQEDIERDDARHLAVTINNQIIRPMIDLNFGPPEGEKYPVLLIGEPKRVPLEIVIEALSKLGPQGLKVEASQLRDRLGFDDPAEGAELVGGMPAAQPMPETAKDAHSRISLNAAQASPGLDSNQAIMDRLADRCARDAGTGLSGMIDKVRTELMAATDLQDAKARLDKLNLSSPAFREAMARGMALSRLAGSASVMDGIKDRMPSDAEKP